MFVIAKGFIYKYDLKTGHLPECEAVTAAYTQAGWIFKELLPETDLPAQIVFEWPKDCPAYYPDVAEI